jgi:hypothetical protein
VEIVVYKMGGTRTGFSPITSTPYSFFTDVTGIRVTVEVGSLVTSNARANTRKFEVTDTKIIYFYPVLLLYLPRGFIDLRPLFWHI